ncbi:MAG: DUF2505 family protein [Actinomycetes bacterium]
MEFTLDQRFAAPPIAVAAALVDPALLATMVELPRLGEASVLTTAHTGDRVRQEVRYRFEADLPGAARRFVDPEQLTWVEVGEHDLASGQSRYLIRPDHYADLLEGRYAARVVEAGGGAARTVKGELRVKVPLVGSKVERAIVDGLREIATAQQRLVEDWLAGAG